MKATSKTAQKLYQACKHANERGALYGFHPDARSDREAAAWKALQDGGYVRYAEWTPENGAGWQVTGIPLEA